MGGGGGGWVRVDWLSSRTVWLEKCLFSIESSLGLQPGMQTVA